MPDDADALRRIAVGYAAAVDTLDGTAFADLFTPDGELWVPRPGGDGTPTARRAGRTQLEEIPSGLARYHATHHGVFGTTYDVDGAAASGAVVGVAHHLAADRDVGSSGGIDTIWYLRYDDDYVRVGGRWLLARRALHLRDVEERRVGRLGPGRS